jgi:hypothetical protein
MAEIILGPTIDGPIENSWLHYVIDEINYGIVNVDFANSRSAKISFQLNFMQNGTWKTQPK